MADPLKLLVFDWDGTVMDSAARIVACMRAAAADLGLEPPQEHAVRNIIGLGIREAVEALFPGRDEGFGARLTAAYRTHFLHTDRTPSAPFAGACETLHALHAEGYLLAVATGKGRQGLARELEETGLAKLFHATCCADETRSKPHPRMLLQIMDGLCVPGTRTLMIGDTEYDMEMARRAGAYGLAATYGVHERERLLRHGPVGCIESISALGAWLSGSWPHLLPEQELA
jgi:phosphoglycolate phosphatase